MFWQTIHRLQGKRSSVTYTVKDSAGNILTDENEILSRWREYLEDLLNPVKASTRDTHKVTCLGGEEIFTAAEVATAIKGIKAGKAAGEYEIKSEMLKSLTGEEIFWITRVCQVGRKFGKTPKDWQADVIIPIFKKGDRKQCTNYRGISLLSLPGKVYAKYLERKYQEIVESKLEDDHCGFRPGRSTTDQFFTLRQIFEKSWEYGKDLFACFVDLEKAYNRVLRDELWKVLREDDVDGQLLLANKSIHCRPEVCVRVNGKQSTPFSVGVGLRQVCVLSPLLFIVYMNWIDKCIQADECATIGNCKISYLLFSDDLVLLSSIEFGLQRALNSFADTCDIAGMKISTTKTEVFRLSGNPDQCVLQVNGTTLKQIENFKYVVVAFTKDGRQDKELDSCVGKASAIMRALHCLVVMKQEL